ncbi:MAG: PQQ-dependent dehydrogenase, methanol/ethanol family [Myxococcales bacterium]|nr:PQQ-dependent dehydrogenase, methanol/ethanol family [Myxococcales bacterium]
MQVRSTLAVALVALVAWTGPAAAQGPARPQGPRVPNDAVKRIWAATNQIDSDAIQANAATSKDWLTIGGDYAETRYSKLAEINPSTIKGLGLVWSYNLESTRGVEATPLVVDGIMYVTASWSVVHAIDVRTGKRLWSYDPKVPRSFGEKGCCDVVNRGVALYQGKIFFGTFDGRLIALDAGSGARAWEKDTIIDRTRAYTITGAPRVFNGRVIIGNGGAEFGVRGYVTAYNAASGDMAWRWFTVPGDPSKPFEDESMKRAAATWDPSGKYWETGGGGTAWDTITFDPELKLVYIGTGNGSPWSQKRRSPKGGDNLYLASVVALNLETGAYVWHYQETPGDNADYTSTQPMILADLKIGGKLRKVILHAPKNGFFFVIDRTNGQLISAKNFVPVNWAKGYGKDGRPIETDKARPDGPFDTIPGPYGAHNWHPMSFNPQTGLVYLPAQNVPTGLMDDKEWKRGAVLDGRTASGTGWNTGMIINAAPPTSKPFGRLIAWDPLAQKEAWRVEHVSPWNGGTLTTAGNLVFQGTADGRFVAYNARTGKKVWEAPTGTGVIAAPSTYLVDGKQYVSIAVGWGGAYGVSQRATDKQGPGTVFTFAIGGKATPPPFVAQKLEGLLAGVKYDPALAPAGLGLYVSHCVICHGIPGVDRGGNIPNLGYVRTEIISELEKYVFNGPFTANGMPDFTGRLKLADLEKLKAFIQGTADSIRPKPKK